MCDILFVLCIIGSSFELKIEADSGDIIEHPDDDKPIVGKFVFFLTYYSVRVSSFNLFCKMLNSKKRLFVVTTTTSL